MTNPQPEPTIPDELDKVIKPKVNEVARIVNSNIFGSPIEGKDWMSVSENIVKEVEALIQTLEKKARADELEELRQLARVYCEKTVLIKILEITGSRLDCLKNLQTKQDKE